MSHQWLTQRHPDPDFKQIGILQDAVRRILSSSGSISLDPVTEAVVQTAKPFPMKDFQRQVLFFWYDYFSCPQLQYPTPVAHDHEADIPQQSSAINSIPAYVARCDFFLALCPVLPSDSEGKVITAGTWSTLGGGGALLQPGAVARESTWYKFLPAGGTGGCSPLVPPSCLGPGR